MFFLLGYDMLMAMRDNIKRLWLHHANFSKFLTTPSEPAHYLSILQSCANEEVSAHALVYFQQTSLQIFGRERTGPAICLNPHDDNHHRSKVRFTSLVQKRAAQS